MAYLVTCEHCMAPVSVEEGVPGFVLAILCEPCAQREPISGRLVRLPEPEDWVDPDEIDVPFGD